MFAPRSLNVDGQQHKHTNWFSIKFMIMNFKWAPNAAWQAHVLPQPTYSPPKKMEECRQKLALIPTTTFTHFPAPVPVDSAFPSVTKNKLSVFQLRPLPLPASLSHRPQVLLSLMEVAPVILSPPFCIIHFPHFTGLFPSTHISAKVSLSWTHFPLQLFPESTL